MFPTACVFRSPRVGIVVLAWLGLISAASHAQEPAEWLGKRVITRFGAVLKRDGKAADDQKLVEMANGSKRQASRFFKVEEVKDNLARVKDERGKASGWVEIDQLIQVDQAIELFTREIMLNPGDASAYIRRALIWRDKKDYDQAIADNEEAIKLDPLNPIAWLNRGNCYFDKNDKTRAMADYSEAIKVDPKFPLPYINRARIEADLKQYDKAIADFTEAIKIDPRDVDGYFGRGLTWRTQRIYDKAVEDFTEVIRLEPDDMAGYMNRGIALQRSQQFQKAIEDYEKAIQIEPTFPGAHMNLGLAYRSLKVYDKALASINEAIRLKPPNIPAVFNVAVTQTILRQSGSIEGYKKVLDLDKGRSNTSVFAIVLGNLEARRLGKAAEARTFLDRSARLDPSNWPYPIIKYMRGELDEPGLMALAVDVEKQTEAHCYIGLDLLLKKKPEDALNHLRWVRDNGIKSFTEYILAIAELERLGEPGPK